MNDSIVRQAFQAYGYGGAEWERLYRYIRSRVSSDEDAKDIAQETLTQAWKNRSRLRNASQLERWLFWIAKNRIADFHRSKRRRVEQTMDPVQLAEVRDAREWAEPEDPFALETLNRLRSEDRTLAELRFLDEYTHAEIADILKMPIGTVKRKVSELKARLKELYEAEEAVYAKRKRKSVYLLPLVLGIMTALAWGCSSGAEAESGGDCGCYTSGAQQYGTAEGKESLKSFLIDRAAKHPEGSDMQKAYRRALARFSELEAYYADSSLSPDDRWTKVYEKLTTLMRTTTNNESTQNTTTGDEP